MIPESIFAQNSLVWVGASILSSLNNEIDRFLITQTEFVEKGEKVPDRFGEAFLFGGQQKADNGELYFNKDFEENLKIQKQILYSNTTPYSARSLASKRESIQSMMKKSIAQMERQ